MQQRPRNWNYEDIVSICTHYYKNIHDHLYLYEMLIRQIKYHGNAQDKKFKKEKQTFTFAKFWERKIEI